MKELASSKTDLLTEDRALLAAFKGGDPAALTQVYYGYVADILAFLKRGFAFDAGGSRYNFHGYKEPWHLENGVQEVFIRAFSESARRGFDGIRPFRNYLFRIARNSVIDAFRSERRECLDIEELSDGDKERCIIDEGAADPESALSDKEIRRTVDAFVEGLEGTLKPFFVARFRQHRSVSSCAQLLGWSEYSVKKAEKQIRKRFFDHMKRHGYFEGYGFENRELLRLTVLLLSGFGGLS